MNGTFNFFGQMGIEPQNRTVVLRTLSPKPSSSSTVHEALQKSWIRFDEAAVLRIESRSAGPCRFSLNRGADKVAGKVLIVDQLYCFASLL